MGGSKNFADTATPKSTLFVRNLPYATTQEQLEALFSDIGPVKQAFMVNDRESAAPRGFAFVKFAMKDDAVRAVAELNGKQYEGRRLAVTYAQTRQKRDKKAGKPAGEKGAGGSDSEGEYDEDRGAAQATKEEEDQEHKQESAGAHDAGAKHKHHKPVTQRAEPSTADGRTVVIRNIPANAPKKVLEKKIRKHGKVETWSMETSAPAGKEGEDDHDEEHQTGDTPLTKTATVLYIDYAHARAAAAKLNGADIRGSKVTAVIKSKDKPPSARALKKSRVIVRNLPFACTEEDIRTPFEEHGRVLEVTMPKNDEGKFKGFAFVQFTNVFDAGKAIAAINGTKIRKRAVAVDWTVPRDVYEKAAHSTGKDDDGDKHGNEDEEEEEEGTGSEDEGTEGSDAEGDENDDMDEDDEGDDDEEEDDEDEGFSDEDEEESEEEGKAAKKSKKAAKVERDGADTVEGRTVFIRNVAFSSSEEDLRVKLLDFGDLEFVKLVLHPETRRPRGTAFAKFKSAEAAEAAIAAAAKAITVGGVSEGGVVVQGRSLNITLAVDRKQAQTMADQKKAEDEKKDKRNLWLAKEGHVEQGTPAAEGVSESDLKKREKSWMEKKRKLKDPAFFVSTTRLSVRNIPTHIDESMLRKAFVDAALRTDPAANAPVKKVILMRDPERKDKDGRPRSMGWAFVEFNTHEHALSALRHINNNPEYYSPQKRLIVEFAVENMAKVKVHEARKEQQAKPKGESQPKETTNEESGEKKSKKKASSFKEFILKKQAQRKKKQEERKQAGKNSQPANQQQKGNPAATAPAKQGRKRGASESGTAAAPQPAAKRAKPAAPAAAPKQKEANKREGERPAERKEKNKGNKRGREQAEEDKLDSLVAQYKKKLFGGAAATVSESTRWFE